MVSVTDDNAGGTMHLWRINDLIYRPEAEAIAELEKYKSASSLLLATAVGLYIIFLACVPICS